MKVAIIGAGLAGISCAYVLKKHGITPVIFEKSYSFGENLDFPAIVLNTFNVPVKNPLKYFEKEFGIKIQPHSYIKSFDIAGANKTLHVNSNAGYIFNRGKLHGSLLHQLESYAKLEVIYDTFVEIDDVRNSYDAVVVATGTNLIAKKLNLYTPVYDAYVRVADIVGNFRTDYIKLWFNTVYSKHSYAYLAPFSEKSARLILIVDNITHPELDYYWQEFITHERITDEIIATRDVYHDPGYIDPIQYQNIYFTGISGGFIDSFMGFGSMYAIESGLLAGHAIATGQNYQVSVQPILKNIKDKNEFRKTLDLMDNGNVDLLLTFLGLPGIKQLVYHNPFYKITHSTFLARLCNRIINSK